MNNNKLFCFIIGSLIAFLAKAEEKAQASTLADSFFAAIQATTDRTNKDIAINASFKCKIPEQKARKIRTRFRSVSFFTLQQISPSAQSDNSFQDISSLLPVGNKEPVLPFYYIFLFRLTPF